MPKKVNEKIKELPKGEDINLTFNNGSTTYVVTRDKRDGTYYLYEKSENGYTYKKSRRKDPCFYECY